jgi:nucleotide-binding universal stress UspA family protein
MFQSILVPLDGSQLAEVVLPHAAALANVADAKITFVRVIEPPSDTQSQPVNPLNWQIAKREADSYLEEISSRFNQQNGTVKYTILEGDPASQIVEFVENSDIDLVLLSSHGKSGLTRWNISSVTRKIIQNSKRSTMIVRAYETRETGIQDFHYQRVLVPLDGSVRSEYVLPVANSIARHQGAELLLVHVVYKPEMPRRKPLNDEDIRLIDDFIERNRQEASDYLQHITCQEQVECHTRLIISDNVEDSLHGLIDSEQIDLMIMSAHGYSGNRRHPFGNITTHFIEYGSAPLLVIQDFPAEEVEPTRAELASEQRKGH